MHFIRAPAAGATWRETTRPAGMAGEFRLRAGRDCDAGLELVDGRNRAGLSERGRGRPPTSDAPRSALLRARDRVLAAGHPTLPLDARRGKRDRRIRRRAPRGRDRTFGPPGPGSPRA